MRLRILLGLLLVGSINGVRADYFDNFTSLDPGWVTDRYEPAGFTNVVFDGDSRLRITISDQDSAANRPAAYSSAFYNTQGRQHVVDITGDWTVSSQAYVGSDAISGANLRRTDIWASCGLNGTEAGADYFIIGYYRFDPADVFNPNAAGIVSGWRVWDDTSGWINLPLSLTTGWHDVSITYSSAVNQATYTIDGNGVYSYTPGGSYPYHLRNVNIEAYNFGQAGTYDVYWDNSQGLIPPVVPEPTVCGLMLMGAFTGYLFKRKH